LLCVLACGGQAWAQTEVREFGSNPGALRMFEHVPADLPRNAPLVVALHGCGQSAAAYDAEPGWQMLADRWHFALLLPQQESANNASRCFNWFEPGDMVRGQGEALSIRQMIDHMLARHGGDPRRVFVTGLSAGGAMTSVMLAAYPEVFAGGAIVAGIPYGCGAGLLDSVPCLNPGKDLTPAQWGAKVRAASPGYSGARPPVSIWQGTQDFTVVPKNMTELVEQWTNAMGIDQIADAGFDVAGYPHRIYKDAAGVPRVQTYRIVGMGHGTPIDPGNGEAQCGIPASYILDADICSSYYIGLSWGLDDLDGAPPTARIVAPASGKVLSGIVTIRVDAADEIGVAHVEFLRDGVRIGSDDTAPYTMSWDTTTTPDGPHLLQAHAVDLVGNSATSDRVRIEIDNVR
jgi:poly(hydroxyalkanoate) depolymerase family esterase